MKNSITITHFILSLLKNQFIPVFLDFWFPMWFFLRWLKANNIILFFRLLSPRLTFGSTGLYWKGNSKLGCILLLHLNKSSETHLCYHKFQFHQFMTDTKIILHRVLNKWKVELLTISGQWYNYNLPLVPCPRYQVLIQALNLIGELIPSCL